MPYVYANVKVKYGQLPASYEAMVTIRRVMEQNGWKLVGAWSTVICESESRADQPAADQASWIRSKWLPIVLRPEARGIPGKKARKLLLNCEGQFSQTWGCYPKNLSPPRQVCSHDPKGSGNDRRGRTR